MSTYATSLIFLARDAMPKRGQAVGQCLSVTVVYCIQTAKYIIKRFSRPGNPVILVFF